LQAEVDKLLASEAAIRAIQMSVDAAKKRIDKIRQTDLSEGTEYRLAYDKLRSAMAKTQRKIVAKERAKIIKKYNL
jgi:hypothetical protein